MPRSSVRITTCRLALHDFARNLCVDTLRKAQHGGIARSTNQATTKEEVRSRLLAAVDELPDEHGEVFLLREIIGLPFKDIANAVDAPENTVKSRMRYALERLQAALSEFEEYARALS